MTEAVTTHYASTGIAHRILGALAEAGHSPDNLHPDTLAGVDEFHLGGRRATEALISDVKFAPTARVLDIGSGIGGAARVVARHGNCMVTGVDLTPEFVDAATELSAVVGLAEQTSFEVGSALDLPFDDATIDVATMIHVGMNIDDKSALMTEVLRVLTPGAVFALYDIMRVGVGDITYPVPWSSGPDTSFVASPDRYVAELQAAGFAHIEIVDRTELVTEVLAAAQAAPPAEVSLADLMGDDWPTMIGNLVTLLRSEVLAPVQITAVR